MSLLESGLLIVRVESILSRGRWMGLSNPSDLVWATLSHHLFLLSRLLQGDTGTPLKVAARGRLHPRRTEGICKIGSNIGTLQREGSRRNVPQDAQLSAPAPMLHHPPTRGGPGSLGSRYWRSAGSPEPKKQFPVRNATFFRWKVTRGGESEMGRAATRQTGSPARSSAIFTLFAL